MTPVLLFSLSVLCSTPTRSIHLSQEPLLSRLHPLAILLLILCLLSIVSSTILFPLSVPLGSSFLGRIICNLQINLSILLIFYCNLLWCSLVLGLILSLLPSTLLVLSHYSLGLLHLTISQ